MAEPNTITMLRSKRARLAGEAESLEKRLAATRDALGHVDAVLRLYGYTGDLSAIRSVRPKTIRFKRREFPALIREIMATGIVQNKLIALETIRRKGWDAGDADLVRKLADCVAKHKGKADPATVAGYRLLDQPKTTVMQCPSVGPDDRPSKG